MKKTLEQIKLEVVPDEYYRPMQIAKYHWMIWYEGKNAYYYILKLIQKNKLEAKNFGLGKTPYFRVKGSDLINFLEKT